jgi:DNA repair photolyase
VLHIQREEFNAGAVERRNFLERLRRDAAICQLASVSEKILLCFTTDAYHGGDTTLTRESITILRDHDLNFCVLTKGGTRALRDMDLFRPGRDTYAATLTCLDPAMAAFWEPGAPAPEDRMAALAAFHQRGIETWVSLEPGIDTNETLAVVKATHSYVDFYKLGRLNYHKNETDWQDHTTRLISLFEQLGVRYYVKQDLAPHLPEGYKSVLRIL